MFALSLSGVTVESLLDEAGWGRAIFLAMLFVLIGCCIDVGKYLFWSQRQRSLYYGVISLVLMGFSWMASCAFLVSSEYDLLRESQTQSDQYVALQQKIEGTMQEIAFHERLIEKRLNSSYHSQWKQGEATIEKISALKVNLSELIESSSDVGLAAAVQQVPTTRLFNELSQVLNISSELIRTVGYGLLGLLLEVSTLGMISLVHTFKVNLADNYRCLEVSQDELEEGDSERQDVETQQIKAQLACDILKGDIPPVLRRIRAAGYGLNIDAIKHVLEGLYAIGVLEAGSRNSYTLAGALQNQIKVLPETE
jgi:hypothetical protein